MNTLLQTFIDFCVPLPSGEEIMYGQQANETKGNFHLLGSGMELLSKKPCTLVHPQFSIWHRKVQEYLSRRGWSLILSPIYQMERSFEHKQCFLLCW